MRWNLKYLANIGWSDARASGRRLAGVGTTGVALALGRWLAGSFLAEREHWMLWSPVLLGAGIAIYFQLPDEPLGWPVAVALMAFAPAMWLATRHGRAALLPVLAAGLVLGGFVTAQWRTHSMIQPLVAAPVGPGWVAGRIAAMERHAGGWRLVLRDLEVADLSPAATPAAIRLTVRGAGATIGPGDRVRLRAMLLPAGAPTEPDGFDFRRVAFFAGLGAVGYGVSAPAVVEPAAAPTWVERLAAWRMAVTERIARALPGATGGVAAALMTGVRGGVPDEIMEAVRASGLAHLLAISGLHMGLVTGVIFFAVRLVLALSERLTLRYPIKKWAAAVAFVGGAGYLLISGATVPTQRAFIMTAIVLLAVFVDRRAISMRNVAWAALVVLVMAPENLVSAGFQMSFAAVIALVALYERAGDVLRRVRGGSTVGPRLVAYVAGVALTTAVAGLATAPFAAYHFNRFADYGLVANLLAVPIMGLWVMPWAVAGFAAMPLGLEDLPLAAMGAGVDAIVAIARTVASWPGASTLVPQAPAGGLAVLSLGGLWLCLWQRPWRWLGCIGIAAGLLSPLAQTAPAIRIDGDAKVIALRGAAGGLLVSSARQGRYAVDSWLQADASSSAAPWPAAGASADGRLRCDRLGCIYRANGYVVSLPHDRPALSEDCYLADIVVARFPVWGRCPGPRLIIDSADLRREGAHALWLDAAGVRWQTVRQRTGQRPWIAMPPKLDRPRRVNSGGAGRSGAPAP